MWRGQVREASPLTRPGVVGTREPADVAMFTTDEPLLRSVSKLLSGNRYRVTGRRQLKSLYEFLSERRTDAVLLDLKLPIEGHVNLNRFTGIGRKPTIPVIGVCESDTPGATRLDALAEGLWDVVELPVESAELVTKLDTWVCLKRDVDGIRSGVLLDVESGHYSAAGIKRRLRELAALTLRTGQPLSCVLFGSDPLARVEDSSSSELLEASRAFSLALHHQTRNSDIVGRLEPTKFVVLAPNTPSLGAVRLAERFTALSLAGRVDGRGSVTFSAGVAGVDGWNGQIQASPDLLFSAANRALNQARASGVAQVAIAWESTLEGHDRLGGGESIGEKPN